MKVLKRVSPQDLNQYKYYNHITIENLVSAISHSHFGIASDDILPRRIQETYIVQEDTLLIRYYKGLGFEHCITQKPLYLALPAPVVIPNGDNTSDIRGYYQCGAHLTQSEKCLVLILVHKDLITYLPSII